VTPGGKPAFNGFQVAPRSMVITRAARPGITEREWYPMLKKATTRIRLDQIAASGVELREDELRQISAGMKSQVCTKGSGGWSCSGDGMSD